MTRIFRVRPDTLRLRQHPDAAATIIERLSAGQAVARLRDADPDPWWFVFADVPGRGIFAGYVHSDYLVPVPMPGETLAQKSPGEPATGQQADDEPPGREVEPSPGPHPTEAGDPSSDTPEARPLPVWLDGWNPSIPAQQRHETRNSSARPGSMPVRRIVIHITGQPDLPKVINAFTKGAASAHYLVTQDGAVHQFVPEDRAAWHSGIVQTVRRLYDRGDGTWRRYKRYMEWADRDNASGKWYGRDALYLDADERLLSLSERRTAAYVMRPDRSPWPDYAYFDRQWGPESSPVGYGRRRNNPNHDSIGIEVLSFGSRQRGGQQYPDAMYETLAALVTDICRRHAIALRRDTVCGHEDVNPVERWGWDPNSGFEWNRILPLQS